MEWKKAAIISKTFVHWTVYLQIFAIIEYGSIAIRLRWGNMLGDPVCSRVFKRFCQRSLVTAVFSLWEKQINIADYHGSIK